MAFGGFAGAIICFMARPFHDFKSRYHHVRSERNSAVRWIQWASFLAWLAMSIILPRKIRPGRMILAACDSFPSDRSSRFFTAFLEDQSANRFCSSFTLASGRRISILAVSKQMPRKVRDVAGPSTFSCSSGKPSWLQVVVIVLRDSVHAFF